MKFLNLIYKNKVIVFFLILFSILLIKFFCVSPLNQNDFLTNYKFFVPDSFDWIANGVRLFQSKEISFRSPGLPLIINVLYRLNILYVLPLLNYVTLMVIIISVFKTTKFLTKNSLISYLSSLFIFLNYSIQDTSNYILADFYAIVFISISLYFLLTKKNKLSFFTLGLSAIFQNLAFFILPLWFLYIFIDVWSKNKGLKNQFKNIKNYIFYFICFFIFSGIWFLYKFILFNNPLYTKIIQFGLIDPNIEIFFFYLINFITLFGPISFLLKNITFKVKNNNIKFLFIVLLYVFSFWTFIYHWSDRRFMLYCIPFFYPLIFYLFYKKYKKIKKFILLFFLLLLLYPTTISIGQGFISNIVPLTNKYKLVFNTHLETIYNIQDINFPLELISTNNFSKKTILFPALAEIFQNRNYLINSSNTTYFKYKTIIDSNTCVDKKSISIYEFSAVLQIEKNKSRKDIIFCLN